MESWASFVPTILGELLRRDGLQDHLSLPRCASCADDVGAYRCIDCTSPMLFCASCMIHNHGSTPLHRLEVRTYTSLNDLVPPFSHLVSPGMEHSSSVHPSTTLATVFILVINTLPVRRQILKLNQSSSSTSTEYTTSTCNFARAWKALNGSRTTASFCVWAGTPHHSSDRRPRSRSTSSIPITKSHFKGNSTSMISICLSCRKLTTVAERR